MNWLLERLREPSTMAGLSALAALFGLPAEAVSGAGQIVAGGLAIAAVVMKDK